MNQTVKSHLNFLVISANQIFSSPFLSIPFLFVFLFLKECPEERKVNMSSIRVRKFIFIMCRDKAPTPVLLPGGSHGQRSLVGSSPWSR